MSESYAPLPETLARIGELISKHGLDRSSVLNAKDLSYETGIPPRQVQALLDGKNVAQEGVETRIRRRVRFLYDTRLPEGSNDPYDVKEIAAGIGVSPVWVRKMLNGEVTPNMAHAHGLMKFFGVDEGLDFLSAEPADALNRALQPALKNLEGPTDPIAALMSRHGLVSVAARGRALTSQQEAAVVSMITALMDSESSR
ncbi:helix-turn-helix domain-containing protein [Streptomyces sp. NPDC000880]